MLQIPAYEKEELDALLQRAESNLRALELFSAYLHICPQFIQQEDVRSLQDECGVDEEMAVRLLVSAACGLNAEARPSDREMERLYFRRGIRKLDADACARDPYYAAIRLPETARGQWKMGYKTIRAYELFTADDLAVKKDGCEIPQVGFFDCDFQAPVVEEGGREWMTVTPSEINTMMRDVEAVSGKVAVFGLGLGYYAFMISQKPDVSEVVVIERDPAVISLFREFLLPQFPNREKIRIVETDAYAYAEQMGNEKYDWAYVDIWHDVLDGVEMYLRMKRLESCSPGTQFLYWIEPSMLAWLRGMALMEIADGIEGPMLHTIGEINSVAQLQAAICDDNLKRIAAGIPLEVARR